MPPGSPSKLATYAESSSGSRSSTSATSAIHKRHPPQDRGLYAPDQLIPGRRDQPLHGRMINPRWLHGESMHTEIGVAARRIDVDLDAGRDCYLKVPQVGRTLLAACALPDRGERRASLVQVELPGRPARSKPKGSPMGGDGVPA